MPRTKKSADGTPKRSAAQIKADKAYQARTRTEKNEKQKALFANIGASFPRLEKERIADTLHAAGITPAQVMRAAAYRLTTDGETAAAQIKADAAAYIARAEGNAQNTTAENTTPNA